MSIHVKEVDENLFDDEIDLCLPPKDSQQYSAFRNGIEKKRAWLKKRMDELSSVAQIAYDKQGPIAFIEYISAQNAPVPLDEDRKTALITCIYKPKSKMEGVGTGLIKAALQRLRQLDIRQVKTLVARDPHWITGAIYCRSGFRLEKTFYKAGCTEPLDLLTLRLKDKSCEAREPIEVRFEHEVTDSLPIDIVCFTSGQCPFSSSVYARLVKALEKIDPKDVVLEVLDTWENCKLARKCGAMYADLFVNGRAPFSGPASQEKIEEEIRNEIDRIRRLC